MKLGQDDNEEGGNLVMNKLMNLWKYKVIRSNSTICMLDEKVGQKWKSNSASQLTLMQKLYSPSSVVVPLVTGAITIVRLRRILTQIDDCCGSRGKKWLI